MRSRLIDYNGKFRIVSLSFCDETRDDLLNDTIDFLHITDKEVILYPQGECYNVENISGLLEMNDYDVCELWEDGIINVYFENNSIENSFFVTGQCNSNCIMCPTPEGMRRRAYKANVENLIEIARHIPSDTAHLTITGGEPFMAREPIFSFLSFLKEKFEETEFLILTNGRVFAIDKYVQALKESIPNNTILGIPIHGSNAAIHDQITRVEHSWQQTLVGIKNLLLNDIRIELRIVISKLNVADFDDLAELIIAEIPGIEYISVIAMEMTGNAFVNRNQVWIPYRESFRMIEKGINKLIRSAIDVRLYNYPLCTVSREYWTLCEKSISSEKIRYDEKCDNCKVKNSCGGVFAGTYKMVKEELEPVL